MTMIRPKIRGLSKTNPPKDKGRDKGQKIGMKGKGNMQGEFLGTQGFVR